MPFFSIVIPVFNAAPYLRECLDSIRVQTFADWECVCVDDGSSDGSGAVLDEFAATDPRFRVVHQANAGASRARNRGIDLVRGGFFLFVDGDDVIVPDALECFHRALSETNADGLACHPEDRFLSVERYRGEPAGFTTLSANEKPVELLAGPFAAHGYVVSKIYRTSLFGRLRFPENVRICEDTRFWADALCVPARWAVVDKPYYAYRKHPGAATSDKDFRFYRECIASYAYVFRALSERMGAANRDIERYARRYRKLHGDMAFEAFRRWRKWTPQERTALCETVADVCAAAEPAFPFRATVRLRLFGHRHGLDSVFVPMSNFSDRMRLSLEFRMGSILSFVRRNVCLSPSPFHSVKKQ